MPRPRTPAIRQPANHFAHRHDDRAPLGDAARSSSSPRLCQPFLRSHDSNVSRGSTLTESGTYAIGRVNGKGRCTSKRIASFAVVTMIRAPDAAADAATRSRSARVKRWWSPNAIEPATFQPVASERLCVKTLRPSDRRDGKDIPLARRTRPTPASSGTGDPIDLTS